MKRGSHSSTNDKKNYFAKDDFNGTDETRQAISEMKKLGKTLPLMTESEWKVFCKSRQTKTI